MYEYGSICGGIVDGKKAVALATKKAVASAHSSSNLKLNFPSSNKPSPFNSKARLDLRLAGCIQVQQQVDSGIMCESCSGRGWLLCEFCKGQKTHVKTGENNRTYRRCPACKSISSRHFYSLYRDGVYHQAI